MILNTCTKSYKVRIYYLWYKYVCNYNDYKKLYDCVINILLDHCVLFLLCEDSLVLLIIVYNIVVMSIINDTMIEQW